MSDCPDLSVTVDPVHLTVVPAPVQLMTSSAPVALTALTEPVQLTVAADLVQVTISPIGAQGPAGAVELYARDTPPVDAPGTYLRFEQDVDGDVQTIYLNTPT